MGSVPNPKIQPPNVVIRSHSRQTFREFVSSRSCLIAIRDGIQTF